MITSLGFKAKVRPQKCKNTRYAIRNVSKKDLSKIIREFEKFEKLIYEKNRPKHERTDSYFYLARQVVKCMMRSDTLNWHNYGGYTEMTYLSLNVYSTDEDESKRIIVHKNLLQNCSAGESELKIIIVHKTLLHNYSADVDKICSTEIEKPEYTITEQKYEGNEVTYYVPNFNVSNVFECGRNNPDVSYERAYMTTSGNKYFTEMLDHINEYHDCHNLRLSVKISKKLFSSSWKKNKFNVTLITLHVVLHFSLPLL